MKKIAPITLIIFFILIWFCNEIYGQSKSNTKLEKEVEASLEISIDNCTGATVIYTKPNRSLTTPEIQMIAKFISLDSINSYRFRIENFTKRKVLNSDKVFIKSSSGIHAFDAKKDNVNVESRIIDEFINWGSCYQFGCVAEGYIYTFILETSKEDFFKIISSNNIRLIFSNMDNPDEYVTNSDISKMNDLYIYLEAARNNDLLNL